MNTPVKVTADANTGLTLDTIANDKDLKKVVAEAKFMEDVLVIEISPATTDNEVPCVILNVNGTNQPVWRGHATPVKRKFVEVLARMKETRYSQAPTNYINPEISNALQPRTGIAYPFQVLEDQHPNGRAWLRQILAEAA